MQHHFIVYFNTLTNEWVVESNVDSFLNDGTVWPTLRPCDNCGQFAYIEPELDPHTGEYCDDCASVPGVATMSTRRD